MNNEITILDNGLRIITSARPQTETVTLGIWTNTGSAYENEKNNGISHFLEHMVFKGTKKRNTFQISEDIEDVGGSMNAYTSRESTVFYAKMLKNDLELATDVLSDFIMCPTFDKEEIGKEQDVVVQEIKQTYDDPSDIISDYFYQAAFDNQAMGRSILGPKENVCSFWGDDLREYMRTNYAAENMVVAAAGNLKHNDFVKMVGERMSTLQPKKSFTPETQKYTGGYFAENRDIKQLQSIIGFEGVSVFDEDFYVATILSCILGGGMSSRLFQEIREKRGLVYSIYSSSASYSQSGVFGVYAGLNAEEFSPYVTVLCDEFKKIVNESVNDKELQRAKVQIKASLLMSLENSSSVASKTARDYLFHNRSIPVEEIVEKIDSINKDDIQRVAGRIFSTNPTYTLVGQTAQCPSYEQIQNAIKL